MPFISKEKLKEIRRNEDFVAALRLACASIGDHCFSTRIETNPDGNPAFSLGWYAHTESSRDEPRPTPEELPAYQRALMKREEDWLKTELPPLPESFEFDGLTVPLIHKKDVVGHLH